MVESKACPPNTGFQDCSCLSIKLKITATVNQLLGDRISLSLILTTGDSLRDDAHACNKSIQDAIERGKHALVPMLAEWWDSHLICSFKDVTSSKIAITKWVSVDGTSL